MPVRQYVIYLGMDRPGMRTELRAEEQIKGFELRNIHDIPLNQVIDSDVPEEIVLAILTDDPEAEADMVFSRIIQKLKQVAPDEAEFKKSLQQLVTLSMIRKLEERTEKQIATMSITYDIETDYLYLKGKEKVIRNLFERTSMKVEDIAKVAEVPVETVLKVKESLKG